MLTDPTTDILAKIVQFRQAAHDVRQTLLANLVMIGEIPAPTFSEARRIGFLHDRFIECGLSDHSTDELGNAVGIVRGTGTGGSEPTRNIVIAAHADTLFDETDDHTITVHENTVHGAGIGDNSLGLAALATLPTLLEHLNLKLRSNLVLLASARSLGRGDLAGIRFFLKNSPLDIHAGIIVEGIELGRLNYESLGMLRGQVFVAVPSEFDWTRFGARSAVLTLNEVIDRILAIPLPRKPRTSIIFGSIEAGEAFDTIATRGTLRLEVRCESADIAPQIGNQIESIAEELSAETGANVTFERLALREPGGINYSHPLIQFVRNVMDRLGVEPRIGPSMSELSTFIEHGIPAVTLGLTKGQRIREEDESLQIDPMADGLAQVLATILAIDQGVCDELD